MKFPLSNLIIESSKLLISPLVYDNVLYAKCNKFYSTSLMLSLSFKLASKQSSLFITTSKDLLVNVMVYFTCLAIPLDM